MSLSCNYHFVSLLHWDLLNLPTSTTHTFSTKYPEWKVVIVKIKLLSTIGLSIGVLVDGLIALCGSYFLLRGRDSLVDS